MMKSVNRNKKNNAYGQSVLAWFFFAVLLILYLLAYFFITRAARSEAVIFISGKVLPVSAFAGVLSTFCNLCLIMLVIFYKKAGFYSAIAILLLQFPIYISNLFVAPTLANIPGFFSNCLSLATIIVIYRRNRKIEALSSNEVDRLKEKQQFSQHLFEQTATALVSAVDAKDTYSHGHSLRVAEYSEKIARVLGKSDEECYKVYYTALLHDVGKIGIDDAIINKKGRLTTEEYEIIKQHPRMGNQILASISEYPYLAIGAHFHHERYDGKGYPVGLKGEDIPEVARIISVADAYDAMSSNRSYRKAIPQQLVREEIVKGAGTQFDPEIAKVMQHLIDQDVNYEMREKDAIRELDGKTELVSDEYRSAVSDGIIVTDHETSIHFTFEKADASKEEAFPVIILFDSLDGRFHSREQTVRELVYYEYAELFFDGKTNNSGVREIRMDKFTTERNGSAQTLPGEKIYDISAVKCEDHVLVKIDDGENCYKVILALPDCSRHVYIGLTGLNCRISDVNISKADIPVNKNFIPRIAHKISYINRKEGDIPNVQIDGPRTAATKGILLTDRVSFNFHTVSLPTARLIWHCPFFVLYSSKNGEISGDDYREYALVRLDGESRREDDAADNEIYVRKSPGFKGWDAWKKANKLGFDCFVTFERNGNRIVTKTDNLGIAIENITTIEGDPGDIYVAITGDQCALTDIKVGR